MLKERKFAAHDKPYLGLSEGLSHQNPHFGIVAGWEALNPHYTHVLYVHDNTTFYTGTQSQRITIRYNDGLSHGIQQNGLTLQAGRDYDLRLVLRGDGQTVHIKLGDALWQIPTTPPEWTTYTQRLTPNTTTEDGHLEISFIGEGNLWVGCASLMPSDNVDGFRADVITAIKHLAPTFLRWPGGNFASGYHWKQGLGERDLRPSYLDPAWKVWESNDVGMMEFIRLTQLLNTEPVLTINMGNGTPQEAAEWVEFCNSAARTEMGMLRASYGSVEPFNVKTWFVGNEQFGNWQVGHVDAETYAHRYLEFAAAIRQKDPTLNLIGVGVPTDLYGHWNELVLKIAGHAMNELSVHYYSIRTELWKTPPSADTLYLPKVGSAHEVEAMLDRTLDIIAAFSDPPVPLAFGLLLISLRITPSPMPFIPPP
jgi:alpha-N-arabinofuranosidase